MGLWRASITLDGDHSKIFPFPSKNRAKGILGSDGDLALSLCVKDKNAILFPLEKVLAEIELKIRLRGTTNIFRPEFLKHGADGWPARQTLVSKIEKYSRF